MSGVQRFRSVIQSRSKLVSPQFPKQLGLRDKKFKRGRFFAMLMEDEDSPPNPLKAFDAFPKVHQSYIHSRSSKGGIVSIAMFVIVTILFWTEVVTWWRGTEVMKVSVERGVGHGMQLNIDITVAMACEGVSLLRRRGADK